jgi:predicted metal-binding membrane protein
MLLDIICFLCGVFSMACCWRFMELLLALDVRDKKGLSNVAVLEALIEQLEKR